MRTIYLENVTKVEIDDQVQTTENSQDDNEDEAYRNKEVEKSQETKMHPSRVAYVTDIIILKLNLRNIYLLMRKQTILMIIL